MTRRLALAVLALALAAGGVGATNASFRQTKAESHAVTVDTVGAWLSVQSADPAGMAVLVRARTTLPEGAAAVGVRVAVPAPLELQPDGDATWQQIATFDLDAGTQRLVRVRLPAGETMPGGAALYTYAVPAGEEAWLRAKTPVGASTP